MLHLICSNVREHQKGKFIVLVTERDIVGASCYLKMINKNSYWFCKVNNSSCSSAGVGQWQGLAELLGIVHPPMGLSSALLSTCSGLHFSCSHIALLGARTHLVLSPTCCKAAGWAGWMQHQKREAIGKKERDDLRTRPYSHFFCLVLCFQHCAQKCSWDFQASFWGSGYWENGMVPSLPLWRMNSCEP